jgi:hypothetical protein
MNKKFNESIVAELQEEFPDCWFKDGYLFNQGKAIAWSGSESFIGKFLAFNPNAWETDPREKIWVMDVHKDLISWANKHDMYWESSDSGTFFLYKN